MTDESRGAPLERQQIELWRRAAADIHNDQRPLQDFRSVIIALCDVALQSETRRTVSIEEQQRALEALKTDPELLKSLAAAPSAPCVVVRRVELDELGAFVDGALVEATGDKRAVLEDISHMVQALVLNSQSERGERS